MPLDTGKIINNRYRIVSLLGQGGFGAVYRAWDLNLKRPCAVKENLETNLQSQKQFENEATVLANLYHQHLPRVIDHFVLPEQGQYLVMDFVDGQDLDDMVNREGPIPIKQAVEWISQIASALDYLHSQAPSVIHRDIKPANIRIDSDGRAYLVDFGLVKLFTAHAHTTPGARGVTPGFSPPEQYGHGGTNACSDIYSLGATLYTLLTGVVPPESVHRYAQDTLEPVKLHNSKVPTSLSSVVDKAMSLNPDRRYQSAYEFKAALRKVLAPYSDEDTLISQTKNQTFVVPSNGGTVVAPVHSTPRTDSVVPSKTKSKGSTFKSTKLLVGGGITVLLLICAGLVYVLSFLPAQLETEEVDILATDARSSEIAMQALDTLTAQAEEIESDSDGMIITPTPTSATPILPPEKPTSTPTKVPSPTMVDPLTPTQVSSDFDLAFASDQDGEFSVYLMDTDTREIIMVPRPSGFERVWWPSFCGSRVAVEAQDTGSGDQWIFLIDILSGNAIRLSAPESPPKLGVPRCSPDGGYLAYSVNYSNNDWALYVTDFSNTYQLYPTGGKISGYASWPASGTDFLFQVITQDEYRNVIYRLVGHPADVHYIKIDSGANPSLSPDGSRMVYSCRVTGNDRTLCLADADGSNVVELVDVIRVKLPGIDGDIQPASAWSADGQWVYFASAVDGDWDIYRIHPNGEGLQNITNDLGSSNEVNPALKW